MKREKRTTKKERKAEQAQLGARSPARPGPQQHQHQHIHCIACGKHLDPDTFGKPDGADFYRCQHGGDFPHCAACASLAKQLVDEHDRTGTPVKSANAWH